MGFRTPTTLPQHLQASPADDGQPALHLTGEPLASGRVLPGLIVIQVLLYPQDRPQIPLPRLLPGPRRPLLGPNKSEEPSKGVRPQRTYGTYLGLHAAWSRLNPPTKPTPSGSAHGPSSAQRFLCLLGEMT